MAEPTAYDEIQDGRLDSLESLVTAEYQPPAGAQYSYPVASQGITQEQFRTMMRAAGSGTFVQHDDTGAQVSYRLTGHGTDSETNQRNTLILKPATTTGRAETVYHGFFHVLTEAMELPFPAVTSGTTYHVCVTYDPRLFKTTPLKIEVYPGTPPTTNGRDSIVLFKVHREPNQLLSQATISQVNPWLGHVINVWSYDHLPEPTSVEYGTLAVVINPSAGQLPETYTNRGVWGWVSMSQGEAQPVTNLRNTWEHYPGFRPLSVHRVPGGAVLAGMIRPTGPGTISNELEMFRIPSPFRPQYSTTIKAITSSTSRDTRFRMGSDGWVVKIGTESNSMGWIEFNSFYLID